MFCVVLLIGSRLMFFVLRLRLLVMISSLRFIAFRLSWAVTMSRRLVRWAILVVRLASSSPSLIFCVVFFGGDMSDIPVRPLPVFRTPYNYDMDQASDEAGLECLDDSLAIQSAKDDADINTIVRRFGLTGELPGNLSMPVSGDFGGIGDFHAAMNLVRKSQEEFLRVPADIRARFLNDPALFMAFLENPDNRLEASRLGLLKEPEAPPEPLSVRVVPDPTPKV